MDKININDVELELDLMDADTMGVYEQLMDEVMEKVRDKDQYKGKSSADALKLQCRAVDDFFDKMFGAGTADKIFVGAKNNLYAHLKAFAAIAQEGIKAKEKIDSLARPFTPNRAQRRAGGKKKKKGTGKKKK